MLTNLVELQLYKNKLTVIPPEIGNLVGKNDYISCLFFCAYYACRLKAIVAVFEQFENIAR